jgi:hypothetical protein
MSKIKKLEEFELNEDFSLSNIGNSIMGLVGKALPVLGGGFVKTIKQKITAIILEKVGIKEKSTLSVLVQEFVDQIPPADLPGILTGEKANAEYLAPKMAAFLQEFIQRKGLDSLAEQMGIETTGWLYSTIRESIQGEIGKEKLTKLFLSLFGSMPHVGSTAINSLDPADKGKFSDALNQRLSTSQTVSPATSPASSTESGSQSPISSFFSGLLTGARGNQQN